MKRLGIPLLKGLKIALLATCISCSTTQQKSDLAIDMCVISSIGGDVICRCIKPDDTLYSIPILECAEKRYNALSPEDSSRLFGHLLKLKYDLATCQEGQ